MESMLHAYGYPGRLNSTKYRHNVVSKVLLYCYPK